MQNDLSVKKILENSKLWTILVAVVLFLTTLKGIRLPNMWSFSHFLFNYDYGFVKRGFIGEVFSYTGIEIFQTYHFFCLFSFTILFANLALIFFIIKDLVENKNIIDIGIALIFSSSLAIVFLTHSVGYFDGIGLLLTLLILKIKKFYYKLSLSFVSLSLMMLIHEAQIVIFFPLIFISLLFSINQTRNKTQLLTLFILSALTMTILFYVNSSILPQELSNAMNLEMQEMTPQDIRDDAFWVLHRSANDNLELMSGHWHRVRRVMLFLSNIFVTGILFTFFSYHTYQKLRFSEKNRVIIILTLLAGLSPLVLNIFGWDWNRWTTLTITTSFLIFCIVSKRYPNNETSKISNRIVFAMLLIFFVSSISGITLFNNYDISLFPYINHIEFIWNLL